MCRVVARPFLNVLVFVCWCVCGVAVAESAADLRNTHTAYVDSTTKEAQ